MCLFSKFIMVGKDHLDVYFLEYIKKNNIKPVFLKSILPILQELYLLQLLIFMMEKS